MARGWPPGFTAGFAALVCVLLVFFSAASGVSATETPAPSPTSSASYNIRDTPFSLTVSPTRLVLTEADNGTTQEVLVVNQGETPVHVDVQKQDFTGARDGSLAFIEESPYSAVNWVEVSPSAFDLEPGQSQTVLATMQVPADPAPDVGDHQVALVFLVPAGDTDANVKVNRGIATPVYVTVPGAIDDTVTISSLSAPWFSGGGPVTVTATVENSGNVHRDFRGDTALDIVGAGTAFSDFTVARETTRDITATWNPPPFCICDLSASIENADGVSEAGPVRVIVFPLIPALIALIALVVVIVVVLLVRRSARKARPKGGQRHALA
jgi:P pilus assembly chaperone PapD